MKNKKITKTLRNAKNFSMKLGDLRASVVNNS